MPLAPSDVAAYEAKLKTTYALVGGTTAVFADIQRAVNHDYAVVFPVAALIILVILMLLLRSLVAPWYLMLSVGLGFAVALQHAGPTIGAAGLILAGTFASLTLAGNTILSQLGFAVSCGIALAAFVMAMFFSPSLTTLIGRRAWWPGHADQPRAPAAAGPKSAAR